ncbi:MAG TPA: PDZ domain-containing protein [Terriglobia bacterium]|nr:PDZ domain-containing protein [Terriglobia bacterium]
MKGRTKVGLALAIVALGVTLGITMLHAQGNDDSDSRNPSVLIQGPNESWLGVDLRDVTANQAREWKLGENYGALVKNVEPDSPASKAGLQAGDVIQEFDGERVRSVAELRRLVGETPPERPVQIEVRRNGEMKNLSATLEHRNNGMGPLMSRSFANAWPEVNLPHNFPNTFSIFMGGPRLGVQVESLNQQLGAYFGVNDGKGVLVKKVEKGSAAEKAGLKAGDCIVKLDSTPIASGEDLHRALVDRQHEKQQEATLTIVRDRKQQTLTVHVEAPAPDVWHPVPDTASTRGAGEGELEARLNAQQLADEARALGQEFESRQGEFQKEAEAARAQARHLRDQMQQLQKNKDQWIKETGPAMQELERELNKLRDEADSGIV